MDKYLVKVKDKNSKIMANDFDQDSLLLKLGKFFTNMVVFTYKFPKIIFAHSLQYHNNYFQQLGCRRPK